MTATTVMTKEQLLKPKMKQVVIDDKTFILKALPADYAITLRGKTPGDPDFFEFVAKSVCDESGNNLLSTEEAGRLDFVTINKLILEIFDFNDLNPDSVEKAKEELKKIQGSGLPTS